MRFGSFVFPVSHVPENDGAAIDRTLEEIELQESLGFEAIWLTEHHFDGACAYADPVVFGAAVAARTSRVPAVPAPNGSCETSTSRSPFARPKARSSLLPASTTKTRVSSTAMPWGCTRSFANRSVLPSCWT